MPHQEAPRTHCIAVDLGGTNIRVALIASDTTITAHTSARTPTEGPSGTVITDTIMGLIENLLSSPAGERVADGIVAIGVASAGPLDLIRGAVVNSPNIIFPSVEIVEPLQRRFELPVSLINDARAGVFGERWAGAACGADNVVYITLSTGIGGGAIVNGRLLLGRDGNAGEIGHLTIDTHYSLLCGCGHPGHWEGYASAKFIPQFFAAWRKEAAIETVPFNPLSTREIFGAAHAGETTALAFMEALGQMNARGISNVIVAYDPEVIVLDGPLARYHGDLVIRYMVPHINRYLEMPRIVVSGLQGRAPILGAAAYALEQL
jgi:glucokinase